MSQITTLKLHNFRCYQEAELKDLEAGLVVLYGPNGAGKTNILEALSLLVPGRGLRGAKMMEIQCQDSGQPWAVSASLQAPYGPVQLGTGLDAKTEKRVIRINGENARGQSALAEHLAAVWLTPQMDRLFIEGPSSRRRFPDRLVLGLYADHSRQVGAYERVMRERNRLLTDKGRRADPAWLSAIEARMAEHAVAVANARLDFAGQLAGQLADAEDGPFPKAELAIDGWLEGLLADGMAAVEAESAYRERLMAERGRDIASGRTHEGVHKTDLVVTHAPKGMQAD
ncbi:MAG: AAA family ATPase, partial [Alphaproteobacteria bacterium]|nr:AAA family ATPase [Alphaproteobacteria bacterium]